MVELLQDKESLKRQDILTAANQQVRDMTRARCSFSCGRLLKPLKT